MKYALTIAHRVCPALSKTAIGFSSKEELVKATTKSLAVSLNEFGLPVKLHVILDGCPPAYTDNFANQFRDAKNIEVTVEETHAIGNAATFGKQVDILLTATDSQFVYFSEDDYLYKTYAFTEMAEMLDTDDADFVTPLDHPDRYTNIAFENVTSPIKHTSLRHWRKVPSTCLTFMTTPRMLRETRWIFNAYTRGHMDSSMWLGATKQKIFSARAIIGTGIRFLFKRDVPYPRLAQLCAWKWYGLKLLTAHKYNLWGPMPSLAFHLSKYCIPPCDRNLNDWLGN